MLALITLPGQGCAPAALQLRSYTLDARRICTFAPVCIAFTLFQPGIANGTERALRQYIFLKVTETWGKLWEMGQNGKNGENGE